MKSQNSFKKSLLPSLVASLVLPICAQGAYGAALEEIVVTAQKREASLQDTPIAVSALSAGQLERGSIQSILDVAAVVPNVELHTVSQSGGTLGASIRGMGFDDLEKTYEPTVGVSIDGVFMASNSGAVVDFFDIAGVEVLRGPQGTLYGRNTIAGVINIKRSEPTGEFGMKLEATAADHARRDYKGIVNMPLGENGGVKLSFRDLTQDSHLFNTTNNVRPEHRDSDVQGMAVRYDFTDSTTATLSYDKYDHQTQPADVIATGGTGFFCSVLTLGCDADSGALSKASGYQTSTASEQIVATIEGDTWTLNGEHTGDDFSIKYVMGHMEFEEYAYFNSWGAPTPLYLVIREQEFEQTSHELQYISNYDGALNFVAGLYYLETEMLLSSGPNSNFITTQDATASAVFGEMTYEMSDLWTLTLGARYTEEEKTIKLSRFAGGQDSYDAHKAIGGHHAVGATLALAPATFDDDNLSYRLILQRELPIGMAYASFSTGFRSGGFNARGSDTATIGPYGSEEVESFELGIRTQPTDNLQINASMFMSDYSDKQQFVVTGGQECGLLVTQTCTFIRNAAEATNDGLEVEVVYLPTDAVTVRASYGYLDAGFDKYTGTAAVGDIADKAKTTFAPENTASLAIEHASSIAGGELIINGTFSHRSEMYGSADWESYSFETGPNVTMDTHNQLNISGTYKRETASGGTIKVVVYGTDVLDEDGRVSRAYDAGAFAWSELVAGRQFGVTLGYEF